MATVLWADVPESKRMARSMTGWYGCPYAVLLGWWESGRNADGRQFYGRCGGASTDGVPCSAHDPARQPSPEDNLSRRVRATVRRNRLTLTRFRALTDQDLAEMRNVGLKMAEVIREIRDEWDDERVLDFFGFPKDEPPPLPPPDPAEFWKQRHDIFQIVGG